MSIAEKLTTIAENEQKIYGAGHNNGYQDGFSQGFSEGETQGQSIGYNNGYADGYISGESAGKQAMKESWWNTLTNGGKKATMDYLFQGVDFNSIGGFNPPYTLKPTYASFTFERTHGLKKITKEQIDYSSTAACQYGFNCCYDLEEIEEISVTSHHMWLFAHCTKLKTIGKLILREGTQINGNHPFINCTALENIEIEGVIPNSVSFQWCSKLTSKSIENIISVLSDTSTGQTVTFNTAVKTTYFNAHSTEYTDAETAWIALKATKPNWTIALNG